MAKRGNKSKYTLQYALNLIKYFDIPPYEEQNILVAKDSKGKASYQTKTKVNDLPFISGYLKHVSISKDTFQQWIKKHTEFKLAYEFAKDCQERILVTNGLRGNYEGKFSIFTAKNILGWRDNFVLHGDPKEPLKMEVSIVNYGTGKFWKKETSNPV